MHVSYTNSPSGVSCSPDSCLQRLAILYVNVSYRGPIYNCYTSPQTRYARNNATLTIEKDGGPIPKYPVNESRRLRVFCEHFYAFSNLLLLRHARMISGKFFAVNRHVMRKCTSFFGVREAHVPPPPTTRWARSNFLASAVRLLLVL